MQLRSPHSRTVAIFALLLLIVQAAAWIYAADFSNAQDARRRELATAKRMFATLLVQTRLEVLQAGGALAPDFIVHSELRRAISDSGSRLMATLRHETVVDDPLLLSAIKNVFRLSTALFCRSVPITVGREQRVATSGIRN